jgi:hypothetical protein
MGIWICTNCRYDWRDTLEGMFVTRLEHVSVLAVTQTKRTVQVAPWRKLLAASICTQSGPGCHFRWPVWCSYYSNLRYFRVVLIKEWEPVTSGYLYHFLPSRSHHKRTHLQRTCPSTLALHVTPLAPPARVQKAAAAQQSLTTTIRSFFLRQLAPYTRS